MYSLSPDEFVEAEVFVKVAADMLAKKAMNANAFNEKSIVCILYNCDTTQYNGARGNLYTSESRDQEML